MSCLVTCEHASNRLPAGYTLDPGLLRLHIAHDPGAPPFARALAEDLLAPLLLGRWSRLLVDLNRSVGHPHLMRRTAWGYEIPFNRHISIEERERRLARYYRPYREAVEREIERAIRETGCCVHISVHSFTPILNGRVRTTDIGILFDPGMPYDVGIAHRLRKALERDTGFRVHLNRPYRGTSDGIVPPLRSRYGTPCYLGFEIELSQAYARRPRTLSWLARCLAKNLHEAVPTRLQGLSK